MDTEKQRGGPCVSVAVGEGIYGFYPRGFGCNISTTGSSMDFKKQRGGACVSVAVGEGIYILYPRGFGCNMYTTLAVTVGTITACCDNTTKCLNLPISDEMYQPRVHEAKDGDK